MIASASLSSALAIFFSLSAGTNSQLRGRRHAGVLAAAPSACIGRPVSPRWLKLRCSQVTMPALGRDLLSRSATHSLSMRKRVADEHRLGEAHFVVAEVGDERAERGVGDR